MLAFELYLNLYHIFSDYIPRLKFLKKNPPLLKDTSSFSAQKYFSTLAFEVLKENYNYILIVL